MNNTRFLQILFSIGLSIFSLTAATAQVQVLRVTFVSADGGSDANSCSRTDPCRQVQRALNTTARGGTVVVLDSGDYEPFTITKSVTVAAEKGVRAVVGNVNAAAGATIEEDGSSAQVIALRGLTFADSDNGISVNADITSLTAEDCSISGSGYGIYAAGGGRYSFKNITVAHTAFGATFTPDFSTRVVATIDDSRFEQIGSSGVELRGTNSSLTIRNSIATYNINGFLASGSSRMVVENSIAANNTRGITVETGAIVSVSHSTVSHNGTGFRNYSATFRSFGNNSFSNNTTNTSGTITSVNQQ